MKTRAREIALHLLIVIVWAAAIAGVGAIVSIGWQIGKWAVGG